MVQRDLCSELERATAELEELRNQVGAQLSDRTLRKSSSPTFGVIDVVASLSRHVHLDDQKQLLSVSKDLGVPPGALLHDVDILLQRLEKELVSVCSSAAPWTAGEQAKLEQLVATQVAEHLQKQRRSPGGEHISSLPTSMPYGQWTRSFPKRTKQELVVHCEQLLKNLLVSLLFGSCPLGLRSRLLFVALGFSFACSL